MNQLKLAMLVGGVCVFAGLTAAEAGDHKEHFGNLKQTPGTIIHVNATTEASAASKDDGGTMEKEICPKCGSKETASISYGYPHFNDELREKLDKREIVLGGCMIPMNAPGRRCLKCENDF